jgi:hypothetical protein
MAEYLENIRELLGAQKFKNEEQIRFSLVSRVLSNLGWHIWNPAEVYPEFKPPHLNDNTRVDIALFPTEYNNPSIFIEIKSHEKLNNTNELAKAEDQLKNYNADLTALFTILTDGSKWMFYYSQEGGMFSEKNFKTIDLLQDDLTNVESAFEMFLDKSMVISGDAKQRAHSYLHLTRKQKLMEESYPEAKRRIEHEPDLNLVEALVKIVKEKGLTVSQDEARAFITENQGNSVSYSGKKTTTSASEHKREKANKDEQSERVNYGSNPPDLKYTKVENGILGDHEDNNWNRLVFQCLRELLSNGWGHQSINKLTGLKVEEGHLTDKGFAPINATNYSVQRVDANKAGYALVEMAKASGLKLKIDFYWDRNSEDTNSNKKGAIEVN